MLTINIRRILLTILSVSLLMSVAVSAVPQNENKGLLVLGDSISSGYGLDGYTAGGENQEISSFANLLSEYLGYTMGQDYFNMARDGQTTEELFMQIKNYPEKVTGYEYITVTIGGNDLLDSLLPAVLSMLDGFSDNGNNTVDLPGKLKGLTNGFSGVINSTLSHAEENIDNILKQLRDNNPNAYIAIQTVYNPFDFLSENKYTVYLNTFVIDPAIDRLNKSIKESAEKHGVSVIDTAGVFKGNGKKYTNIEYFDIHPGKIGHMKIFELIQSSIEHYENNKNK